MILKILHDDGYIVYDGFSRISVKKTVRKSDNFEDLKRHSDLTVAGRDDDAKERDEYAQVWGSYPNDTTKLFLVGTVAYICNDNGKTLEVVRPK